LPFRPQVVVGSVAQPGARASAPAAKLRHEPAAPGTLQERQGPLQSATSQQTPSTQLFELHSPAAVHGEPSGLRPHEPALQAFPGAQSCGAAHDVLQAVPAHR
jgi:hypothetical protein